MKITKVDLDMQARFVDGPDAYGFGTTQSAAKLSNSQISRLLKLNLIKVCRALRGANGPQWVCEIRYPLL